MGLSAGGSGPQPRSIESVDPRDAARLVEREVADTTEIKGYLILKILPSRELSRDSGDEFSSCHAVKMTFSLLPQNLTCSLPTQNPQKVSIHCLVLINTMINGLFLPTIRLDFSLWMDHQRNSFH